MGSETANETTPTAKQIVFLFMAATVVAVVVFLCGVLVGRGVPLASGLTVSGAAADRDPMYDLPPTTLSTPRSEPSAAASESGDLTYYRRLSDGAPPSETLRPTTTRVEPESTEVAAPADPGDGATPGPEFEATEAIVEAPAETTAVPAAPPRPTEGFSVQVTAVLSQASARRVASQLTAKGYPTVVVDPEPNEPVAVYRVRIGPYAERAEAERIMQRLETEEQLKPFLTR